MSTRRRLLVIALVAIGIAYGLKIPPYVVSHAAKTGRVVDDATGSGIVNAAVIATATMTCSTSSLVESHTAAETEYRLVVRTDDAGIFRVPNAFQHFDVGHLMPVPGVCSEDWSLEAFRPGYVLKQDADRWAKDAVSDVPAGDRLSTIELHPSTFWEGTNLRVEDVHLVEQNLPIAAAATYYSRAMNAGGYVEGEAPTDDERQFRKAAADYYTNELCAMDPDAKVDWSDAVSVLVGDRRKLTLELDRLEPAAFARAGESGRLAVFAARSVCAALRALGS